MKENETNNAKALFKIINAVPITWTNFDED